MNTVIVERSRQRACPMQTLDANHYLGRHADPCRCTEYEQTLAAAGEGDHVDLSALGLRPRALSALARQKLHTTADISGTSLEKLLKMHGVAHLYVAVTLYRMAERGISHPDMIERPTSKGRRHLQSLWEMV